MRPRLRVVVRLVPLLAVWLVLSLAGPAPVLAQEADAPPQAEPATAPGEADTGQSEASRRDRKQKAKEARIEEYLRKREERRAEKEMSGEAREARRTEEAEARAQEIERKQLAEARETARQANERAAAAKAAAPPEPAPETLATLDKKKRKPARKPRARTETTASRLPRGLARAQANLRSTELALDPTVGEYLDLIDRQEASAEELAAFGSFVAQSGMVREALAYYDVAVRLDQDDPVLWVNAGTLRLQAHDRTGAASAFGRALSINPNNAVAHYNMGAVLDELNKYEEAVQAYKTALALDPSLGDPRYNPQAANNDLLLAVKLMLYQDQAGSLAVPLLDVTTGRLPGTTRDEDEP